MNNIKENLISIYTQKQKDFWEGLCENIHSQFMKECKNIIKDESELIRLYNKSYLHIYYSPENIENCDYIIFTDAGRESEIAYIKDNKFYSVKSDAEISIDDTIKVLSDYFENSDRVLPKVFILNTSTGSINAYINEKLNLIEFVSVKIIQDFYKEYKKIMSSKYLIRTMRR